MRTTGLAAAALALSLSGCTCCTSPTFVARGAAARHPGAAPPLDGPTLRALHLADFGDRTCQQDALAAAVAAAHARRAFDLALFPGDNVYQCGPDAAVPGAEACAFAADGNTVAPGFAPPPDPWFGRFEEPLASLAAPTGVPVWLALGNHDVAGCAGDPAGVGRLKACLEVAHASPVWTMPGRHYSVDVPAGAAPPLARFIVVDSNLVKHDYGGFDFDAEAAFVGEAARGCRAPDSATGPLCFLVGHHPPVTAGGHASDATAFYLDRMERLFAAAGPGRIRGWLAGHDHDLQHLRTPAGVEVFVSGNGSRGRPNEHFADASAGGTLLFGSVRWGYGILEVGADGWRYRFEGDDGAPLYCCAAEGIRPCEPVDCW
jgi:tartrate-resistant acid phosphatase type 5